MLKKIMAAALVAALAALLTPAELSAYGAAHVGYTHVGPNGVYHAGATEAYGRGGAYGGASYHAGYSTGGAYHAGYGGASGGAAYGGYHYTTGYSGGAAAGEVHYGYIR